jgi:glutamate dehydrogenase
MVLTDNKKKFLDQIKDEIQQNLEPEKAAELIRFSSLYLETFPQRDLLGRKLKDIYGSVFGSWHFMQTLNRQQPKVRIFNPEYEKHGWQSVRTVVTILAPNMPFILDSIRLELNRRNITIHTIHHAVMHVERNKNHQLVNLFSRLDEAKPQNDNEEALFYLEISRHSDKAEIAQLRETLEDIISEVKLVVDDFGPMKSKIIEVMNSLPTSSKHHSEQQIQEVREFLAWLHDEHFTLLGFEELEVSYKKGSVIVEKVAGKELGLLKKRPTNGVDDLHQELVSNSKEELCGRMIEFDKSYAHCRVHRYAYPDYVTIKNYDKDGRVCRQFCFLGLYASIAYTVNTAQIPVIRQKVAEVLHRTGFHPLSHDGKELQRVLEVFPRDELFLANVDQLYSTVIAVHEIQERRQVRLFLHKNRNGKFYNALVYTPKDLYCTELRERIQDILSKTLAASESQFTTYFSESVLTRTYFVFKVDPENPPKIDMATLEAEIIESSKHWQEQLRETLIEEFGEEQGNIEARLYDDAFPPGYQDDYDPRAAVNDIKQFKSLDKESPLGMSLYRAMEDEPTMLRFRLYHFGEPLVLSDIIPILENLGLRVVGESPYDIDRFDGQKIWLHDFKLTYGLSERIEISKVKDKFQEAFERVWYGDAESDAFNKLILGTQLAWRDVALLRAYARYMKQISFNFSGEYIAETLGRYLKITQLIVSLFSTRFNPTTFKSEKKRASAEESCQQKIIEALDGVNNLNEDRIIRQYLELIKATLRTNLYQQDEQGKFKNYFSFKLKPELIPDIPKPRPMFEIFVYSPRMEGVHLRGGKVARGGLRWSDRQEDYRTEVLGLVKAQQVKNAVIVPVGAKGGFVVKNTHLASDREAFLKEGVECYKTFIRGILDITDNLVEGKVSPPVDVLRKDEDDTYMVVAADKGTASFSDIANEISRQYGFWLGDAFASGGSIGYDHKKMGITARGAWVSVQRHFKELGINTQEKEFTVVGIGDMAGDVFGNGMLRSEKICLVAAFNHMHIFIDPDPDSRVSFKERKRLFEMPRSSWADYDETLISKGGGVFLRSAKSVAISAEMKQRFAIKEDRLTPNQLISRLLKAPVDLIWNGGIGTYIKSRVETDAQVGDKANDPVRVNGADLQCKVIGEGGNLGVTQLGRVEFGLKGGASNTDFIDNAGGVDCSDHEVNIKILLNEVVARGDLTEKQRRLLLEEMTSSVSDLVLANNYRQTQALSIAEQQVFLRLGEYKRLICSLESKGKLDREMEFIPSDETLLERKVQGVALTRAELSVLISYVKGDLKEQLADSDIPDDPYLAQALETAFPPRLVKQFKPQVYQHRLRREIIATQIANDMVNHMGITFVERLEQSTGENCVDIARAYITARDVFMMEEYWQALEALDYKVPAELQMSMMIELMRLVRRASRWFLRNRRSRLLPEEEISRFQKVVKEMSGNLDKLLQGHLRTDWELKKQELADQGVPPNLADYIAGVRSLYSCLGIAEASEKTGVEVALVAPVYFALGEELELDWFSQQIAELKIDNHWQALARENFRDDLEWQQRALTAGILRHINEAGSVEGAMEVWFERHLPMVDRWRSMLTDLHGADTHEFAMYTVAIRELLDLAQSSEHCD